MALGMEPDEVEQFLGPAKVFGRTAAEHRSPAQLRGRNADDHVLQASHPTVDSRLLEGAQHAETGDFGHAQPRDLSALEADRSPVDRMMADDRIEQRRLPRAVWTDEAEDLSRRDAQGHVLVRDQPPEGLADALELENERHGPVSASSPKRSGQRSRAQPRMPTGKKTTMTTMSRPRATRCQPSR